jgi:hypothetical protein|tara:strand:- start:8107 stop:8691 length:585 start_codon:yes stop_codon:yes gene_type:complete
MGKVYFWGPLLYHTKVNEEDLKSLSELCIKDEKKNFEHKLVGHFKTEYHIDTPAYTQIIEKYFGGFIKAHETWYGKKPNRLVCDKAWVNYMKAGDYNPPHIHVSCDYSSVLYLSVPQEIHEEAKQSKGVNGYEGGPGSIMFIYGEHGKGLITDKYFMPVAGDFFIFPAHLRHVVSPFKSSVERVSIAANFKKEK